MSETNKRQRVTSPSRIRDVTKEVLSGQRSFLGVPGANAVQIIGGVQPPEPTPRPSAVEAWQQRIKGNEFLDFAEYEKALNCFERAIEILCALGLRWQELADVWEGKAKALSRLNRHDEAVRAFDEAIAIERELYVEDGEALNEDLAGTIMNKGLALTNAGRTDEGAACYRTALEAFRRKWQGGSQAAGKLVALTLFNIAESNTRPGLFEKAIGLYDESLEVHRRIAAEHEAPVSADAAVVLKAKSHALLRMEQFEKALAVADEAVKTLERLVATGRISAVSDLSWALRWKGKALDGLHRSFEASACYKRAAELVAPVKPTEGYNVSKQRRKGRVQSSKHPTKEERNAFDFFWEHLRRNSGYRWRYTDFAKRYPRVKELEAIRQQRRPTTDEKLDLLGPGINYEAYIAVVANLLRARGFTRDTIDEFGLGFCSRGFLKDRVVIPLHDREGKRIGYAGRVVDDATISKDNPRYRFPSKRKRDGKIIEFRKTLFLYNGYGIRTPVDNLVVTEGFASVWWLHQNGYPHTVAAMGADCSERQAELIVTLVKPAGRVWILPDGDDAGRRFVQSVLLQVSPHRFTRWVKIAEGSQPTDLSEEQLKSCFTL